MIELKEAVVEHRVRLDNGVKVFADQKEKVRQLEERTAPKQPSILKVVGITITVVAIGATALWGLAMMLRDRPTVEQIDKIIDHHDTNGHEVVRDDMRDVQKEQAAQRTLIEGVKTEQKTQGGKLDTLLDRTPAPRTPRRRRRRP